jgi:hypothetical protein
MANSPLPAATPLDAYMHAPAVHPPLAPPAPKWCGCPHGPRCTAQQALQYSTVQYEQTLLIPQLQRRGAAAATWCLNTSFERNTNQQDTDWQYTEMPPPSTLRLRIGLQACDVGAAGGAVCSAGDAASTKPVATAGDGASVEQGPAGGQ